MTENTLTTQDPTSLRGMLSTDLVKKRFEEVLGPRRGAQFVSSIITVVGDNKNLQKCKPATVIAAAAQAAALDLSIVPTIGHAAIVPYGDRAAFQAQWKGIVQLAHRTSKYKSIHLAEICEGQLIELDEIKGTFKFDASKKKSDKIMGFFFRFDLLNGFVHEAYWSVQRCVEHGFRFSKSFQYGSGLWMEDKLITRNKQGKFDKAAFKGFITLRSGCFSMCAKTVVKNELSKWGPLSADMQDAFTADQAVIRQDGTKDYIDSTAEPTPDETEVPDPKPAKTAPPAEGKKANEKPAEDDKPNPAANSGKVKFKIDGVVSTQLNGNDVFAVRRKIKNNLVRYYTNERGVADFAKQAQKDNAQVSVSYEMVDENLWIELIERAK